MESGIDDGERFESQSERQVHAIAGFHCYVAEEEDESEVELATFLDNS